MKIYKMAKPHKNPKYDQLDSMRSIRKQMPKPSFAMDDDINNHHRIKDIGREEDMATLEELKNEASITCELKGHTLGHWKDFGDISTNRCLACDKQIIVNTRPKPNELDISGEAMSLDCN